MDADEVLAEHAAAHHGVFRGQHALMAGLTAHQIEYRIERRLWVPVIGDVYRIHGSPATWRGDLLAACWTGGFRAVASHRSAAELRGLPGGRRIIEITCRRWRRAHQSSIVVHETKALVPIDVTVLDGIPVTTPARTLFDLCSVKEYGFGMIELAFENGLRRGLFSTSEIAALERRLSRPGRAGGPTLRRLLAMRAPNQRATESDPETLLLQALRRRGLPEPVAQHEIWRGNEFIARPDLAYPDAKVAIEYDSDEHHAGRLATRRDRLRRQRLLALGWITVDVGSGDLRGGGVQACDAIAAALALASPTRNRAG
jgi:very-short-patch-repair endonuclease